MKIIHGSPGFGRPLGQKDVNEFLSRKLNIQIATNDESGYPNIQPTWFYYDQESERIFITTSKFAKKVANIRQNPNVYFSVDEDDHPYWCVKGKAKAKIFEEPSKNVPIVKKVATKYYGTLEEPFAKEMVRMAEKQDSVVLELAPRFFSTWDFSDM